MVDRFDVSTESWSTDFPHDVRIDVHGPRSDGLILLVPDLDVALTLVKDLVSTFRRSPDLSPNQTNTVLMEAVAGLLDQFLTLEP